MTRPDVYTRRAAASRCSQPVVSNGRRHSGIVSPGLQGGQTVKGLMGVIRDFVRLAVPYFRSEERWRAAALLAAIVVIELAQVAVTVQFNLWNRRFFDALQMRHLDTWLHELGVFLLLGCAMVTAALLLLLANQTLLIWWRRWMTQRYLGRWLASGNHYRLMVGGQAIDNPDQRISMDVASGAPGPTVSGA